MSCIFVEGWDKYGGVNTNSTVVSGLLTAGEWTSAAAGGSGIATGLSATGYAFITGVGANSITKTLAASYSRLIGGIRFSSGLGGVAGIQFIDAASSQCGICINLTGTIAVRNGSLSTGTILGTSAASVSANTIHYLEWDITFGNSAAYQLWLDGVSILSGTGDTTATANNSASGFSINGTGGVISTWDDLYLFDATGTTNNAVLLTSPRIETQFPLSDGAVQFAVGAAILGSTTQRGGVAYSPTANNFYVRPFIPSINCTLSAVGMLPGVTNGTVQLRPVVYADNAGSPGTLMSAGSTVVGIANGTYLTMPLTTSQTLVAGTRYWLGLMNDIIVSTAYAPQDTFLSGRWTTATFASGAPGTAPATTGGQNSAVIFGVVTSPSNSYCVSQNPPQGNFSYVYDTTTGHEDLYGFPALSVIPSTIYAVAAKVNVKKSDAGAKTMSVRLKSGATDSAGSGGTQAPGASYGWLGSLYPTDPATGTAWTYAGVNAAQAGVRVES